MVKRYLGTSKKRHCAYPQPPGCTLGKKTICLRMSNNKGDVSKTSILDKESKQNGARRKKNRFGPK